MCILSWHLLTQSRFMALADTEPKSQGAWSPGEGHSSALAHTCVRGNWTRWCQVPFSPNIEWWLKKISKIQFQQKNNPGISMQDKYQGSTFFIIVNYKTVDANNTVMEDKKQWRKCFQGKKKFSECGNGLQEGYQGGATVSLQLWVQETVYSCIITYHYIIFHTNCKPTFAPPYM